MKKVIVPVVAALLFAATGQAQTATKQAAAAKTVTTGNKTTVHKPVRNTTSVTPASTSRPATKTGNTAGTTAIKRKHHYKKAKAR